jgi:hypothetical protein
MKKTRKTPTLRELFANNPNMVEATGEFQAMILGHGEGEPKTKPSHFVAVGKPCKVKISRI